MKYHRILILVFLKVDREIDIYECYLIEYLDHLTVFQDFLIAILITLGSVE